MKKISHIVKEYVSAIKKIPMAVASHAFLAILLLIIVDLALGIALFYQYVFLLPSGSPQAIPSSLTFNQPAYDTISKQWQTNQQDVQAITTQKYTNPFNKAP